MNSSKMIEFSDFGTRMMVIISTLDLKKNLNTIIATVFRKYEFVDDHISSISHGRYKRYNTTSDIKNI